MDDLIRREDALRIIRDGWSNHCSCKDMCDAIKELPTAYNVDKVVEEMEKLKNHYHKCCLVDYNEGAAVATEECMSIARRGGVNE